MLLDGLKGTVGAREIVTSCEREFRIRTFDQDFLYNKLLEKGNTHGRQHNDSQSLSSYLLTLLTYL